MKWIIDIPNIKYNEIKEFPMCYTEEVFEQIRKGTPLSEELENIKTKVEKIRMKEPLISSSFECYGFKDKTTEDIKTEVIEILNDHITELKGEQK